jgi:DNA methylase
MKTRRRPIRVKRRPTLTRPARLIVADCVKAMAAMPPASVDAIVTDPPYGLEFMGKEWDRLIAPARGRTAGLEHAPTLESRDDTPHHRAAVKQPSMLMRCANCGGNSSGEWGRCSCERPDFRRNLTPVRAMQEWHEAWAAEALRVLKPGGHLLAFGGTRTYHRLACAIEDAGFEIRDQIQWMYGSGFPKSLNVSKAIDSAQGVEGERGPMKRGGERLMNQAPDGRRDGEGRWGNEVAAIRSRTLLAERVRVAGPAGAPPSSPPTNPSW